MVDINIEFAHFYADEVVIGNFSSLEGYIDVTSDVVSRLKHQGLSYSLNVLVDNYFSEAIDVNTESLVAFLAEKLGKSGYGNYLRAMLEDVRF